MREGLKSNQPYVPEVPLRQDKAKTNIPYHPMVTTIISGYLHEEMQTSKQRLRKSGQPIEVRSARRIQLAESILIG